MRRGRGDAEAIETAVSLARDGHVIAMFPEGTRRKKGLRKTRRGAGHTGAARIALDAGVPLVPAGIRGTDGLRGLRRGGSLRHADRRSTTSTLCPPAEAARIATERVMVAIAELEASL